MKKKKLSIGIGIFVAIMMIATIILAACPPVRPAATGITISPATAQTWTMGALPNEANRTFAYTLYPANATGDVVWHSSNTAVATINAQGVVTVVTSG